MNQKIIIKKLSLIIVLVLIVVLGIYLTNRLILDKATITFNPGTNNKIVLLSASYHFSFTTTHTTKITVNKGVYTVIYIPGNKDYHNVIKIINIKGPENLQNSSFPYSQEYLNQLLISDQNILKQTFLNSSYGQLVSKQGYSFNPVALVGNKGNIALIRLIPNNPLSSNVLLTIMVKNKSGWSVETKPNIILTKFNTTGIPDVYLNQIDRVESVVSNLNTNLTKQIRNLANIYIFSYENRDDSYQKSNSSWLSSIQNILTPSFYSSLYNQYTAVGSTGLVSSNYQISHQKNFIINTTINNCLINQTSSNTYTIGCNLTNQVINNKNHQVVPKNSIPYGYTLNGQQPTILINLINQNNQLLISSANT